MYQVAEFARLAGVTVRTLHYYDRLGLLKPLRLTEAGHRVYRLRDLARLQQILTLKWMGFSLRQIHTILTSPSYDLRRSLAMQKAAIDAKISELQAASDAIERVLTMAEQIGEATVDTHTMQTIIQSVGGTHDWVKKYYSDAGWNAILERQKQFTPEAIEQGTRAWQAVFDELKRRRHDSPDSPAVQALIERMIGLTRQFTGDHPEIEQGLARLIADNDHLPEPFRPYQDPALRTFIEQAYQIYQARQPSR